MSNIIKFKRMTAIAIVGIIVNMSMFFIKLYIGLSSNSVAIYADALNNLLDSFVCIIAVIGFYVLTLKPSRKYPFGLGRTESIINLLISLSIVLAGLYFLYISFERFLYPTPIWYSKKYAAIVASTIVVKFLLALFYLHSTKKYHSTSIKGLYLDSLLDMFVTFCVLLSFTLSQTLSFSIDGIAGMIIGTGLMLQGMQMLFKACSDIIGKRSDTLCNELENFLSEKHPQIIIKDVQCHCYGDVKVFNITLQNCTVTDVEKITKYAESEFNSEIFIRFGD
ncbi:MAG TPA: cation diffusion facilitator family transporter [Clostridiales bacterium]|nr:cation diffusion facilitator family transporter [Clostridiales bacterium]